MSMPRWRRGGIGGFAVFPRSGPVPVSRSLALCLCEPAKTSAPAQPDNKTTLASVLADQGRTYVLVGPYLNVHSTRTGTVVLVRRRAKLSLCPVLVGNGD